MLPSTGMAPVTCSALAAVTVMPMRPGRVPSLSRVKPSMICVPASWPACRAGVRGCPAAGDPRRRSGRGAGPAGRAVLACPCPAVPIHPRLRSSDPAPGAP